MLRTPIITLLLLLLLACSGSEVEKQYVFLGHTYDWHSPGNRVDPRIERLLDSAHFDQVWLGGDICARTSAEASTLSYIDSLFDLGSGKVHWALGNHDIRKGSAERIREFTGRPSFYFQRNKDLGILVLNSLIWPVPQAIPPAEQCREMDRQYALVRSLPDSTADIRHLVVLHHYCLMTNNLSDGTLDLDTIFNFYHPELIVSCRERGTFREVFYPFFQRIQQAGTQVIFIGGDIGMRKKAFRFQTQEGIWFLGSGINNSLDPAFAPEYVTNFDPDSFLIFRHKPENHQLEWEFVPLGRPEK